MSPSEALQVKARFNGCFSDSLLESSLLERDNCGFNRLQEFIQRAQGKKDVSC